MPGKHDAVGVLRLTVGSDGTIRVGERPSGLDAPDQAINLDRQNDPLKFETISVLVDMARHNRLKEEDEYQLLGSYLYSVLLDNRIGQGLHRALQQPQTKLVRVVLAFEDRQDELSAWPWEYLYCPVRLGDAGTGYFLSKLTKLVLIRNLPSGASVDLTVEAPPVKVLFVASRPRDMSLSYEGVLDTLKDLSAENGGSAMSLRIIEPTTVDPDSGLTLAGATYRKVIDTAATFEPHMIHIVAHGHRPRDRSELAFMDSRQDAHWVSEERLALDLSSMELPSLRFVFLEACESALPGSETLREHHAAISGVAMRLAHAGIPAVVGMQYQIQQGASNVFARAFYKSLIMRETVDVAVLHGRRELDWAEFERVKRNGDADGDGDDAGSRPGFGLPVLYLTESCALFPPEDAMAAARPEIARDPGGGMAPAARAPDDARRAPAPPSLGQCPRCGEGCDEWDKLCERCSNYLKCPTCSWPVLRPRSRCGNCGTSLQIAGVELSPARGVRAQPPAAGEAGSWG